MFRKILVRCPNWVGDMAMAMPALRCLRENNPNAEIVLLLKPYVAAVPEGAPWFNRIIPIEKGPEWHLGQKLRREKFDLAVILPNSLRSVMAPWIAQIPIRVGYRRQGRGWMLTHPVNPPREKGRRVPPAYRVDSYLKLLETLGFAIGRNDIELFETEEGKQAAMALIAKYRGSKAGPLIVFNPGAAYGSAKCWPPEYFAKLGKQLVAKHGGTIMVMGGPNQDDMVRKIAADIGPAARAVPGSEASLSTLKSLVKRADFLATSDSGPRHFGVAFNTPGIVFEGPMDTRYTATTQGRLAVLREPVDCAPCNLRECPIDHRCMTRLTPERAFEAARKILG